MWKPVCGSTRACASCGSHFLVNVKLVYKHGTNMMWSTQVLARI